jgi:hypothetical protein
MRNALIFFLLLLALPHALFAQKEDNIWLLGGSLASDSVYKTCMFDFSGDTIAIEYLYENLPYRITNTSISDASGSLLCFSNGKNIYNRNWKIMENGLDFYPNSAYPNGFTFSQSYLLLPFPGHSTKIIYIYGKPDFVNNGSTIGYVHFNYAIIDMELNNGLGRVVERGLTVESDTLTVGCVNAVRHGNGRDWWVVVPHYDNDIFYRYLLTPTGLIPIDKQVSPSTTWGLGQAVFSPDGQWYARYNWHGIIPDSSFSTFDLYRFDRCTGLLGEHITKTYNADGQLGRAGGIAFSNSSRYLYVSKWDTIFQYDLQAPDILASEEVVAVYDGFLAEFNQPTRFFTLLLAPDNKIYCSVSNVNSRYLHIIEKPDLPGPACEVRQHAIHLPVFNNNLLPNMPYYRLREWVGSPCDTLGSVAVGEAKKPAPLQIAPNPATDAARVALPAPAPPNTVVVLTDMTGRAITMQPVPDGAMEVMLSLSSCRAGLYLVQIQTTGITVGVGKVSVVR